MKGTVVLFSLAILLAISGFASAATYQQRLPGLEGGYGWYDNCRGDLFDFGSSFATIDSISLRIVGEAWDSSQWIPFDPMDPTQGMMMYYHPEFSAGINGASPSLFVVVGGGSFDVCSGVMGNWESVRHDGFGDVQLSLYVPYYNGPPGGARVDEAYLVVEGQLASVPEPSSLLALGGGLIGLCGAIRRRK